MNPKNNSASTRSIAKIPGNSAVSNEHDCLWSASFGYKCGQRVGKQVTSIVVPCCSARNVPEELGLDVRVHRNELHSEPVKLLVESASNPVVSIDLHAEGLNVKDVVVENIGELRLLKLAEGLRQSYSPSGDINFWIIQGDCLIAPGAR